MSTTSTMRGRWTARASIASLLILGGGACGSSDGSNLSSGKECTAGATQSCVGPAGCRGGQVCLPDGSAWGACDCGGIDGGAGAAGSGAAGAAGGAAGVGGAAGDAGVGGTGGAGANGGASGTGNAAGIGGVSGSSGADGGAPPCDTGHDVIFFVSRSQSAVGYTENGTFLGPVDYWTPTMAALSAFVGAPEQAGLGAALYYAPHFGADACDPQGYVPPSVPHGVLPTHLPLWQQALSAPPPFPPAPPSLLTGFTAAVADIHAWADQNPSRDATVIFVVLVERILDHPCSQAQSRYFESEAATLLARPKPIRTFVIQYRADPGWRDVAEAGGTQVIKVNPDPMLLFPDPAVVEDGLLQALSSIRAELPRCQ